MSVDNSLIYVSQVQTASEDTEDTEDTEDITDIVGENMNRDNEALYNEHIGTCEKEPNKGLWQNKIEDLKRISKITRIFYSLCTGLVRDGSEEGLIFYSSNIS